MVNYTIENFGYKPILTFNEYKHIDDKECVAGYLLGLNGKIAENNRSRSYYHGYLNGLNDGGYRKIDLNQKKMISNLLEEEDFILEKVKIMALIDLFINGYTCN